MTGRRLFVYIEGIMKQTGTVKLISENLVLRRFSPFDFFSALNWYRSPLINRYFTARIQNNVYDTFRFVFGKLPKYRRNDFYCWAVCVDGKMQGMIQAMSVKGKSNCRSLYYMINPNVSKRGYMTEAVSAVLEYLKGQGVTRVFASCDAENIGSKRVIEKSGFSFVRRDKGIMHYKDGRVSDMLRYKINL